MKEEKFNGVQKEVERAWSRDGKKENVRERGKVLRVLVIEGRENVDK